MRRIARRPGWPWKRTGAGILGVDHGDLVDAHLPQDDLRTDAFLAGNEPGGGVADDRDLEVFLVHSGGAQRGLNGFTAEFFQSVVRVLAEAGHSRADDGNISHRASLLGLLYAIRLPVTASTVTQSPLPVLSPRDRSRRESSSVRPRRAAALPPARRRSSGRNSI